MSSIKNLAKETIIYGMSHILPRIFHFVVMTIYLTHRFNDDTIDYGIYTELYAYATIILAFMIFRMDTAYFRFGSKADDKDEVLTTAMVPVAIVSLLLCTLLVIFSQNVAIFLQYPSQPYYVTWFAFIIGLDALTTLFYARFRLANRPMRFLFFRVLNVVATVLFVFLFLEILPRFFPGMRDQIYQSLGMQRELDFVFFANLLASLLVAIMMIPEFLTVKYRFNKVMLFDILKYSWPLVIVAIAGNINQSIASPLQKSLLGGTVDDNVRMIGIYGAGAKLAILLNLFTTAFNYAAEPFFFNNAAKRKSKSIYGDVALAYTIFACVVVLGTYLFIDIVMMMIGASYREGIVVVPILLVAYIFLGLYYMVGTWYKLSDNTLIGAWVSIIGMMITLVLSYSLIPTMGIVGSAWAALACFSGMVFVCYQWGKKYYPIHYNWYRILGLIGFTSLIILISYLIRREFVDLPTMIYGLNTILFMVSVVAIFVSQKSFLVRMKNS